MNIYFFLQCFQYYMSSLQLKRSSLTSVELNILDLYLLKTRESKYIPIIILTSVELNILDLYLLKTGENKYIRIIM